LFEKCFSGKKGMLRMTNSEAAFLAAARELSFSRAASKCFLTQQCLSDHIRRLEKKYGTALFIRRPKVELTDAGRALQGMLLRQKALEDDLSRKLTELEQGSAGQVTLGLGTTRAQFLVPALLKAFFPNHPNVEVSFVLGDTCKLQQKLALGEIDCLIGVNAASDPDVVIEPLIEEPIYLVTPRSEALKHGAGSHADLSKFTGSPFVRNAPGSTLNQLVDEFLSHRNICLRTTVFIGDYSVQLTLSKTQGVSFFCPGMIACAPNGPITDDFLTVLPISGLKSALQLSLVYSAERNYPECVKAMFDTVRQVLPSFPCSLLP
jgi:DNA-binding transcriptional LysR family regulator